MPDLARDIMFAYVIVFCLVFVGAAFFQWRNR